MIKTNVGCMVLGLLLVMGNLSAQKEKATSASIQIPFQLTTYNNLSIQAILNGVDTVQLMFHTAANALTLTEETIKQLKSIQFVATTDSVKSWGGQANSSRYSPRNKIQIGSLSWDNQAIWENQLSGQYTQGKFGMDLFKNWVVEIDFDHSLILLHKELPSNIKG
ncbi:MAG TPA: aspartyl protease family protein, partial [Sediminibacterium sp.]|nr:aspartyl protease family protein [Sediminibacterium sp.]